jgi:tetratricopeptide (TPR) repeat protein
MYHALIGHIPRSRIVYFRLCTLIILSAYPAYLIAQREQNSQEINELRKMARSSESRAEVYEAIDYYTRYFDSGGYDDRSAYQLAGLYYLTRDYSGAKKYYDTVLVNRPKKFPKAFFYGGIVCMSLQEYDQAIENFDTFRKVFRGRRDPDNLRRLARDLGSNAEWAMVRIDSVANIQIGHLGNSVNQPHIEFSPFPVDEHTLIYGSQRNDTSAGIPALRRLYTAEKKEDFWYSTGMLEGDLNSDEYHSGNAAISPDGKRMYFTRCRQNWRDETICEIFLAVKDGGTWQVLEKLPYPINDENHTTTQPAVGVNYRTGTDILYFVSDRDGGRGGLDIWYSVFDIRAGEFKEPRNAGSAINTRGDECCPFFDAKNNTLYFSSKGHPGFGGFDIFRAAGSLRRWTAAEALPQPINSSYDDTYFSTLSTGQDGFFTSNRPGAYFMENGSCCDDIFYFRYNTCIKAQVSGTVLNITNYDVYDELNEKYHLGLEYPESNVPAEGVGVQV